MKVNSQFRRGGGGGYQPRERGGGGQRQQGHRDDWDERDSRRPQVKSTYIF